MKIQFLQKLIGQPWDITPSRGRALLTSLIHRLQSERPEEDDEGEPLPTMQIVGDIAYIPIVGALILGAPQWAKDYGLNLTDPNDIAEEIREATNDPRVALIVFDIDSPGGESVAGNKLYDLISAIPKPTLAWCADGAMMCSAAFNAALPCTRILAGPYACVGSVGSYLAMLDDSAFWEMMGMKWEVFRSGEFKGIGETALTDEQRAFLQETVDRSGAKFRANVTRYRSIAPEHLRGQWWDASEALPLNFIDGLAADRATAIRLARG